MKVRSRHFGTEGCVLWEKVRPPFRWNLPRVPPERSGKLMLPLVAQAFSNLFDAHPCLEQEVSCFLHPQTDKKLRRRGSEDAFESVPN